MDNRRAASCLRCGRPVIRDGDDNWIHSDLRYPCHNVHGEPLTTVATVEPEPWWAFLNRKSE